MHRDHTTVTEAGNTLREDHIQLIDEWEIWTNRRIMRSAEYRVKQKVFATSSRFFSLDRMTMYSLRILGLGIFASP